MTPGTQGGLSWAPMTFSPLTNLIYVPGSIINSGYGLRRQPYDAQGNRAQADPGGIGFYRPPNEPRAGTLTAIDPTTNKIVWQKRTKFPLGTGSGLLSTASGLIFHGESDGRIVAYDIKNGNELWSFQTGAGADAPVITYEVGGEQYVAILAGGNSFQLSQPGDNLWAFKLGGTMPPAAAPAEPPTHQPRQRGSRERTRPRGSIRATNDKRGFYGVRTVSLLKCFPPGGTVTLYDFANLLEVDGSDGRHHPCGRASRSNRG